MDELSTQLKELGLGDHETIVLNALILSSPASASAIAKKCGLSRSSVYTTLSSLTSKGLVGTTYKNDIKQFVAHDISALERMVEEEKKAVEKKSVLLGSLKKMLPMLSSGETQLPQIIFFEGQEGLKKIYLSMMRQAPKGSILYLLRDEFVWKPEWKFIFDVEWHSRVKRWKKEKNIRTRLLINPSQIEKARRKVYASKKGLESRFLPPKDSVSGFALYVLSDTIAILSMEKNNLVGIRIVNPHLAENLKKVFGALWKSASG